MPDMRSEGSAETRRKQIYEGMQMSDLSECQSGSDAGISKAEKCPRCGDLFYDPKTMIKDARQHAFEWEGIANQFEVDRDKLLHSLIEFTDLIEDGILVRNTDKDGSPDWLKNASRVVMALKRASDALDGRAPALAANKGDGE